MNVITDMAANYALTAGILASSTTAGYALFRQNFYPDDRKEMTYWTLAIAINTIVLAYTIESKFWAISWGALTFATKFCKHKLKNDPSFRHVVKIINNFVDPLVNVAWTITFLYSITVLRVRNQAVLAQVESIRETVRALRPN